MFCPRWLGLNYYTFELQINNKIGTLKEVFSNICKPFMPLITLTSDYGISDPYVAALKGRIYAESQTVPVVDISHQLTFSNFIEAAYVLGNTYAHFPKKTVHVVAFNELGGSGKLLAAELDGHYFLLADNGLLGLINPEMKINKVIEIDLKQAHSLFPSRDILLPAALHLLRGGNIDLLGLPFDKWLKRSLGVAKVNEDKNQITGEICYIDNNGNVVTNISKKMFVALAHGRKFEIKLPRNRQITELKLNYNQVPNGSVLALFNSMEMLELAVNGSESKAVNGISSLLGLSVKNQIDIHFK